MNFNSFFKVWIGNFQIYLKKKIISQHVSHSIKDKNTFNNGNKSEYKHVIKQTSQFTDVLRKKAQKSIEKSKNCFI